MKKLLNIFLIVLVVFMTACTSDPLEDLDGNGWKKERNVVSLLLEGQIGTSLIERDIDEAKIQVYAKFENIADLSNVEIKSIDLAYGASSVSTVGATLDFTTADTTAIISVVSGSGSTLDWKVSLKPFKSDLEGEWYVGEIRMYCDMFTWESWGWEKNEKITDYLPELSPELDNVFTFTVEGADAKGNPFGSYEHSAGPDGIFGNYGDAGKGWDFNERFRKIPMGSGSWLRDFERNKVIITDENNIEHELDLEVSAETEGVTLKAALPYLANLFNWSDTDWSYEELAHMSNPMWYNLTRERVLQTGNDITGLTVKDQVGDAVVDAANKTVTVKIEDNGADKSAIEIISIGTSYGASADKAVAEMLDFSTDNSTQITITSEAGESAVWTIKLEIDLDISDVSIAGTWNIGEIGIYADLFTWESWGWDKSEKLTNYLSNANPELDNTITFNVDGKDGAGQPYGTYENNAGTDGLNADFTYDGTDWPETDFNDRYRKVPTGTGTWILEGETVKITDAGGVEHTLTLEIKTETEVALTTEVEFLADLFDWDVSNYSYEEVAHMSKKMWYNLNKQ
ncbi:MAG: hypothetical protein JEZ01_09945 [Labilibaculum sp.]|nr:hypothetical protein [Labilibaculum sp.]MBI9058077.1 hypothetical protein [Labilibaculum sp.]